MIISFLEGSDIMETGVEQRINRQLRRIIKDVQDIKMYFYCTSNFMTLCEWEIRKLQATYPQKRIEVLRVIESNDILKFVPAVQYMGHIMPCDDSALNWSNRNWIIIPRFSPFPRKFWISIKCTDPHRLCEPTAWKRL